MLGCERRDMVSISRVLLTFFSIIFTATGVPLRRQCCSVSALIVAGVIWALFGWFYGVFLNILCTYLLSVVLPGADCGGVEAAQLHELRTSCTVPLSVVLPGIHLSSLLGSVVPAKVLDALPRHTDVGFKATTFIHCHPHVATLAPHTRPLRQIDLASCCTPV